MPTEHREEFTCVADRDGVIRDSTTVPSPGVVYLKRARVTTTNGCRERQHVARATITGPGVDYDSGEQALVDCEEFVVSLGDLRTKFFRLYTMAFEIDGFEVGEEVVVIGILEYDDIADPDFGRFNLAAEDALHLPGFGNVVKTCETQLDHQDVGAWINVCKSLMFRWFALFDVRSERKAEEIAELLSEKSIVRFPDTEVNGRAEFVVWYNDRFPLVKSGYHNVEDVDVRVHSRERAAVALNVALHAELANGNQVDVNYVITAELTGFAALEPSITKYTANPVP